MYQFAWTQSLELKMKHAHSQAASLPLSIRSHFWVWTDLNRNSVMPTLFAPLTTPTN
jgi:hypothetical protein